MRGFPPTIRFHKFQFCSIFKVLLAVRISRDSLFIISREVPFVKNFFEIFFEVFSGTEVPEKPSKAVVMRLSAAFRVALAPDSLTIIPPGKHFVNTFFHFFDKFFAPFLFNRYIVVLGGFAVCCGAEDAGGLFFPLYKVDRRFRKGFTCGLAAQGLY